MHTAGLFMYLRGSASRGSASGGSASGRWPAKGSVSGGPYRGVCLGGLHPGGLPLPRGVYIQWGSASGGSASGGSHLGVVCIQGVLYPGRVCPTPRLPTGLPTEGIGQTPSPPVNRMTHRCKTLPCPRLRLRAVTRTNVAIDILWITKSTEMI